jgi:hypothetical protein
VRNPKILLMGAAAVAGMAAFDPLHPFLDQDGFASEADREASLFLGGHNVHLSPAAREIVERRLRRQGGPEFSGYSMPAPRGTTFKLDADIYTGPDGSYQQRPKRKFKHNRRG